MKTFRTKVVSPIWGEIVFEGGVFEQEGDIDYEMYADVSFPSEDEGGCMSDTETIDPGIGCTPNCLGKDDNEFTEADWGQLEQMLRAHPVRLFEAPPVLQEWLDQGFEGIVGMYCAASPEVEGEHAGWYRVDLGMDD